ncbi:PulJ/GspJ family protein [Paenibacillus donghaensis]|uniref:Prepilin-type cleavage/methylation domain-containing protein n=1 Tax=Paenibacillus donghaensis TaxID=414771 RepID=A0A2Z2KWI4_9BACL|nr:prepilin-type N-terminal cleavage/methylation domain-containing protein [Paenibacillus donghaensis]ASA24468.1 hypothetical protein B9T62_29185 [Paenibacillus donghaensis]
MRKFADLLRREQGFTLIELIAALSLFSLVAGLIYGVMMFGVQSYQRVTMENTLRDESDLLMSSIITEIYTFAPHRISSIKATAGSTDTAIILQKENLSGGTEQVEIAVAGGKLSIKEVASSPPGGTSDPDPAATVASSFTAEPAITVASSTTVESATTVASSTTIESATTAAPSPSVAPSSSPENYDTRTSVSSMLEPSSQITLQCSAGDIEPCESGLIHIKLSLSLERGGKLRQLDLESKFGF